ncbi:TonB-dependent siderophore receptor [Novosphingobium olei]|uniref:TonB-dependent receptor n=1 Tax=Novosphingobium olei TaxID=2728851 RepID=A0A7Y0BQB0_9SPHN|nr:TonB-dependent receptor [Novosphingobium olei]NML93976.1 TonB-dependent receptor [Novosphingobium olei]
MGKLRLVELVRGASALGMIAGGAILPSVAQAEETAAPDAQIVVTAKRDEAEINLKVDKAASSDRTGKGLRTLPQSTTVVTSALLKEQQVQSVTEALRNVSGTTASFGNVQGVPSISVRGFGATGLSNGLSGSLTALQPVDNLERIEVLKGPSAILSGADSLGGTVNLVTKRPSADPILDVNGEYGSFDTWAIGVDASNALTADKKLSARIVGRWLDADRNYGGYAGRNEHFFAPALRFKDAKSDIILGASIAENFTPLTPYTYVVDTQIVDPKAPGFGQIAANPGNPLGPRGQGIGSSSERYYFNAEHKAASWLTLVARGEHGNRRVNIRLLQPLFTDPSGVYYSPLSQGSQGRNDALDAYARFNFKTGPFSHALTAGYNYSRDRSLTLTGASAFYGPFTDRAAGLAGLPLPEQAGTPSNIATIVQNGLYAQDLIEFNRFHIYAGYRRNRYHLNAASLQFSSVNDERQTANTVSAGAVVDVVGGLSVYGNFLSGYAPNFAQYDGFIPKPQRTRNIEGGIKLDLFGRKLAIVASYYRNKQNSIVNGSLAPPFYQVIDGLVAEGFEADVNGQILPGWTIAATFSQASYKYTNPNPFERSDFVIAQPKTRYSFFTAYEIQKGPLKSLGASVGVYGFSRSIAGTVGSAYPIFDPVTFEITGTFNNRAPVFLGAQTSVDANIHYKLGDLKLNLGVKNLFDRKLYNLAPLVDYIPLGAPRTFTLTATYSFF